MSFRPEAGLLDTSVVIQLRSIPDELLPATPLISAVTLAELTVGPLVAADDATRAARQAHVQFAEDSFDPLPVDASVARAFGQVAASLRASGRKPAARAFDALIAATALAHGLPLYTANAADLQGVTALELVEALPPR